MKSAWFFTFVTLTTFLSLLSGCMAINQPTLNSVPRIETVEVTPTITIPTKITNIATFTLISPLSSKDALANVRYFLSTTSNCRLPCWFGIIPGQSKQFDVSNQLTLLRNITSASSYEVPAGDRLVSSLTIPYPSADNKVIEIISSYLNNIGENDISLTGFFTRSYGLKAGQYDGELYGDPAYNELLKQYTITGVVSTYGKPDQIFVTAALRGDALITPGFGDYFELHVWYPNQGIFMTYKMSVEGSNSNYLFCPSDAFILGVLTPPDLGAGYQDILLKLGNRYQGFFPPSQYVKTSEEALGISIEEFYKIFRYPTNRCLETPTSIWRPK